MSYRVNTEAVCVCDAEGVVFVGEDNDIRNWVDTQGVVIRPEHRTDIQRQWSQVTLGEDGFNKLGRGGEGKLSFIFNFTLCFVRNQTLLGRAFSLPTLTVQRKTKTLNI